ncbi:MAG TPA: hypothetical protein VH023_16770 [Rhodopila sp.]|jgi:hypothetical protein|nr:hypothetical protein [Rhodopila sp.]
MDKNLAGLIGVVGALVAIAPASAATAQPVTAESALQAYSYADLLKPIPNALALLKESDAAMAESASDPMGPASQGMVEDVQFIIQLPHHHHHHYYYHHHHHHHHHHRHHHHHHHDHRR